MQKKVKRNNFFALFLAMIMFLSPVFISGCSFFGRTRYNGNTNNNSGGGSSITETPPTNNNPTPQQDTTDPRPSLEQEEYDDYFKNYRITYQTDAAIRRGFDEQIIKQNFSISSRILEDLKQRYASAGEEHSYANDKFFRPFSHSISVSGSSRFIYGHDDAIDEEYISLNYDTGLNAEIYDLYKQSNSIFPVSSSPTDNTKNWKWWQLESPTDTSLQIKLTIAFTLIQHGYDVDSDEFKQLYNQFTSNISLYFNSDGTMVADGTDFSKMVSEVSHLGVLNPEIEGLEKFVQKEVIGDYLVNQDKSRYKTGYSTNGSNFVELTTQEYNKFPEFLNDDSFAMEFNYGSSTLTDANKKLLYFLTYYANDYVKKLSYSHSTDFNMSAWISTNANDTDGDYVGSAMETNSAITTYVFDNLIKGSDETFNFNVWNYNATGHKDEETKTQFVEYNGKTLFSIRLPNFKNYVNTIHSIVNKIAKEKVNKDDPMDPTIIEWRNAKGSDVEYPYDERYPNIPYTFFADFDNHDMLFYGNSGVAKMFSGFQCYQNMVLMPKQDVDVESGALFIVRQLAENEAHFEDGTTDGYGDFDITVYLRYYDANSGTYATWTDSTTGESSEFYKIGTETVKYEETDSLEGHDNDDEEEYDEDYDEDYEDMEDGDAENYHNDSKNYTPTTFDFEIKKILLSAVINGAQNSSWTLPAFDDSFELRLHRQTLVNKENFGQYFREDYTPDGNKVVVFDGANVGAPSYIEFVFYCSKDVPFQFCFYPGVAYSPNAQ